MENILIKKNHTSNTDYPKRKHPIHFTKSIGYKNIIVFMTICTKNKQPWLANEVIHNQLIDIWKNADAWLIGRYVIMPNHIHLFAQLNGEISLENWTRYWKSLFTKIHNNPNHKWQTDYWDVQIKDNDLYWEKKEYIFYNPVRNKLSLSPEDWQFKGEIFEIEL